MSTRRDGEKGRGEGRGEERGEGRGSEERGGKWVESGEERSRERSS